MKQITFTNGWRRKMAIVRRMTLTEQLAVAMLVAVATGLHMIERLLPPLPFPGAKLGLANLATLIALRYLGFWPGVGVSVVRSVLGGLMGGSLMGPGFWMGFAGATSSAVVMGLGAKTRWFRQSNVGLSVAGAVTHSTAQVMVAVYLTHHAGLWIYLPVLLGLSMLTGVFIGIVCDKVAAILPYAVWFGRKANA